jgi:hypothetical protein
MTARITTPMAINIQILARDPGVLKGCGCSSGRSAVADVVVWLSSIGSPIISQSNQVSDKIYQYR